MPLTKMPLAQDIRSNGRIALLVKNPRKYYSCRECQSQMEPGEPHYNITYAGAGLGNIKFPDRVCLGCLPTHLHLSRSYEARYEEWARLFDWAVENSADLEENGRMRGVVIAMQRIWQDMRILKIKEDHNGN